MLGKILGTLGWLLLAGSALAVDLSGTWQADDGGTYYLRQNGSTLTWYGEEKAVGPRWANVFDGRISAQRIRGGWLDVPKGSTQGSGELQLEIRENGNVLEATRKSGGFGGSRWTRVGYQPQPVVSVRPAPGGAMLAQPGLIQPSAVQEDCVAFNNGNTAVSQIEGRWKIIDGNHFLFDFGNNRDEARNALRIIRHYRLDRSCFVGRPDPSLTYLLQGGTAPAGTLRGEDCIAFNPANLSVSNVGGRWKIVEGNHWMFDFGANQAEASQALAVIRTHGFTHSCFVGRPKPSFSYLRK